MDKVDRLSGFWVWPIAVIIMSLESSLLGLLNRADLIFHTPLCITAYLGFCRRFEHGSLLFVLLVPVFETLAGGPVGMYTLGAGTLFVGSQLLQRRLGVYWGPGHAVLGIVGFVVVYTTWTVILSFLYGDTFKLTLVQQMGGDIIRFSIVIWPIGYLFAWLDENFGEPVFHDADG